MAITAEKEPYEFLARWENKLLKGAHFQRKVVVTDDGNVSETIGPAEAVAVGGNDGFPLADILDQITIGAVAAMNAAFADKAKAEAATAAAEAESEAANRAKAVAEKERDDALAQLSAQDA